MQYTCKAYRARLYCRRGNGATATKGPTMADNEITAPEQIDTTELDESLDIMERLAKEFPPEEEE